MEIVLKQRRILCKKLAKEKTLGQRQERTRWQCNEDQDDRLDHPPQLAPTSEGSRHEEEGKLSAWVVIVNHGKAPPSFEKWTNANNVKLLGSQSNVIEMAHTALGHMEAPKKKSWCWRRSR